MEPTWVPRAELHVRHDQRLLVTRSDDTEAAMQQRDDRPHSLGFVPNDAGHHGGALRANSRVDLPASRDGSQPSACPENQPCL